VVKFCQDANLFYVSNIILANVNWRHSKIRYLSLWFSGAFAKIRKATISFVMSACPSVCPSGLNKSAHTGKILLNLIFEYFWKSVEKIQVALKFDMNNKYFFTRRPVTFLSSHFYLEWGMFQTKVVEEIKTHILCSPVIFSENPAFKRYCWKIWHSQTGHRWQHNTAQYLRKLDT
jgi:hypothetical protein